MLSVGRFKTEDEAIAIANDTSYGLGAGVYSSTCLSYLNLSAIAHEGTVNIFMYMVQLMPINACAFHPLLRQAL